MSTRMPTCQLAARQAKVRHLGDKPAPAFAVVLEQDIAAAEVAVDDALVMQIPHGRGDLGRGGEDDGHVREAVHDGAAAAKDAALDGLLQHHTTTRTSERMLGGTMAGNDVLPSAGKLRQDPAPYQHCCTLAPSVQAPGNALVEGTDVRPAARCNLDSQ